MDILQTAVEVAIAGTKSGADSAGIFIVKPENKYPVLEGVIKSQ